MEHEMTTRILMIATLLTVSAALAVATPVLAADSTPGYQPPANEAASRAGPLVLPGTATPMPTPQVDGSAVSRDIFGGDPADALDDLGTVTLSNDGTIEELPASDALRAIFAAAVKGYKPGT
jgi:hypothetical protein